MTTRAASITGMPRMRPDVEVYPRSSGSSRVYVLKDPLSLRYFQLREEEHFVWRTLDGTRSFEEIRLAFNQHHAPRELSLGEVKSFVTRLMRDQLLVTAGAGQGQTCLEQSESRNSKAWMNRVANLLVIRLPGWDPDRFLTWLCRRMDWVFSKWFAWCSAAVVLMALFLVQIRMNSATAALIPFQSLIEPQNLFWLSLTLACAKVLHEFGHAIVCRRLGAECHEMGVMLLAFTPCLYCDVSDAWTLRSKWQRIAVSAAGIGVDVLLASLCAIVWCCTEPGLLHAACLNMMFVCSVSTLIFNGNPLMRYDGYYVLQDLIEHPNLRQSAQLWTRHVLVRWFTGVNLMRVSQRPQTRRGLLFAWGVASTVYLWFVVAAIVMVARATLKPYGLTPITDVVAVLTAFRLFVVPGFQLVRTVLRAQGESKMKWPRFISRAVTVAAACLLLAFIPLPKTVSAPATVQPQDAEYVFAQAAGRLVEIAPAGSRVAKGDVVARLKEVDTELAVAELQGQFLRQQTRVANLRRRQLNGDDGAAAEVSGAVERLADLEGRLAKREADLEKLTIRASSGGVVLNALPAVGNAEPGELPSRSGYVTDAKNLNCAVSRETMLCVLGEPSRSELIVTVDQDQVSEFKDGQQVVVQLDQTTATMSGRVVGLSRMDVGRDDENRTNKASYRVRIVLEGNAALLVGDTGLVRVSVEPSSLCTQLVRYVGRTFRSPL